MALAWFQMKADKYLRKQAEKAERSARASVDAEMTREFLNLANAYRGQAAIIKAKRKAEQNRSGSSGSAQKLPPSRTR